MAQSELSDLEWEFIKKVLPNKTRGAPRKDDRRVLNGIFYVLRRGINWRELPKEFGPYTTVYNRYNRWSKAGVLDQILEAIADSDNMDGVMIDEAKARVHHSATALKKR